MRRRTAGKGRAPRIHLELFHSTERECPEFNYKDLLHQEEKKRLAENEKKKGGAPNGIWDPFSDNDEDVEKIAKQFEQKYGSSSTYGRSKGRNKQDDYADIGAGYDENDSFIDNTDGYDEIIPPECDTAWGGFYINSGSLEFKNVSGAGTSAGEGAAGDSSPAHTKKTHKRALSSSESEEESSSSDEESEASVVEKNRDADGKDVKTNSVTDSDKSGEDRKRSKSEKSTYSNAKDELPRKKRKSSIEGSASSGQETSNKKSVKENIDNRSNVIESNNNEGSTDSHSSDSSKPQVVPSSDNHGSSDSSRDTTSATTVTPSITTPIQMPTDLSPEIQNLCKRLKTLADSHFSSHTGKLSGAEVNEIILNLELLCRRGKVPTGHRGAVFSYAAQLLRRGKAGLVQRARRLAEDHVRNSTNNSPIEKLKNIIEKMKPSLLETYRIEAQKIMEINKQIASHNANLEDDKKLQERRLPKRRFPWNDQVRAVLQEILQNCGMDIDNSKEVMRFLQTGVLPLFPPGFVRMPTLMQQVRNAKPLKGSNTLSTVDAAKKPKFDTKQANVSPASSNKSSKEGDPETPSPQPKTKENELQQEIVKTADGTLFKNDRVLSVAIERINVEADKLDSFKVQSDNISSSQTVQPNNVSISITSVFPKKCDSEKTNSSPKITKPATVSAVTATTPNESSVIIKPFSETSKEISKNGTDNSTIPSNVNSVIKSVESVCTPESKQHTQNVGSIKVKPPSSLFDKSTIAKIISGKNTDLPNKPEQQQQQPLHYEVNKQSDKVFSKPNIQDCSHLIKRKSGNLLPSQTSMSLTPIKQDFVKPSHKSDHTSHAKFVNQNNTHIKYLDTNLNGNKQKETSNTSVSSQVEQNHSFLKPSSSKTEHQQHMHTSPPDNNSALVSQRIVTKPVEDFETFRNASKDHKTNAQKYNYKRSPKNNTPVMNLDDSSSDDCVEILTDDEQANKSVSKMNEEQKRAKEIRQLIDRYEKLHGGKEDIASPDKWLYSMVTNNPHISYTTNSDHSSKNNKKVAYSRSFSEPEFKKAKQESPGDGVKSDESDKRTLKISVRNDSVIKDAIKSDRIIDIVPEKSSNLLNAEKDDKDNMDQEDFNRVMQDLKELQDLQMQGAHQRLYDDSANS